MAPASDKKATGPSRGTRTKAGRELASRYRRLWLYSVVSTALVSLTPLVVMTFVNSYQYHESLKAEAIYPLSRLVSSARRYLEDFLEERRAALAYVVKQQAYEDLTDPAKLQRILLNMKGSFGGFIDLGVIDPNGNQCSYAGPYELEGKNYEEQDWFQEVCVKGVAVSDVFLGYRNFPHFVIAVRTENVGNNGFYILRATIDSDVLNRYISSLELRPSSDYFLINRAGVLQTPSRHGAGVMEQCGTRTPPFSSNTEVMEVVTGGGQPAIMAYAYVQNSPFIFVVLGHPDEVTRSSLHLRTDMLWLLAISIAAVVGVILGSSAYLVNRIREADYRQNEAFHKVEYTNKMASIGRLAAGVAHEINNPLAIIQENAGLLQDLISAEAGTPDRDRLSTITQSILKAVDRGSTVTHRLLGFAKRMEPYTERLALGPLLEEVLGFQGKEAEYRNITVHLVVPEDLPDIHSDRGQLQQVFLNILSNAFAAVEDGGEINISVEREDENTVAVTIRDNGPGIPEEHMARIFEPFFSTKGDYGTGLGLSITFGIVEKLGGSIDVQSAVGQGASFTVRLPIMRRQ
jgi:signal transduction histidine kinase